MPKQKHRFLVKGGRFIESNHYKECVNNHWMTVRLTQNKMDWKGRNVVFRIGMLSKTFSLNKFITHENESRKYDPYGRTKTVNGNHLKADFLTSIPGVGLTRQRL